LLIRKALRNFFTHEETSMRRMRQAANLPALYRRQGWQQNGANQIQDIRANAQGRIGSMEQAYKRTLDMTRTTHHARTLTLIRTWRKTARWWREKAAGLSSLQLGFEQRKIARWYDVAARELYREVLSK
jgi:hypothetical protein